MTIQQICSFNQGGVPAFVYVENGVKDSSGGHRTLRHRWDCHRDSPGVVKAATTACRGWAGLVCHG